MDNNIVMFIIFYIPVTLFYTVLYVVIVKDFIKNVDRDIVETLMVMFCGYALLLLWVFIAFGGIAIIVSFSQGG